MCRRQIGERECLSAVVGVGVTLYDRSLVICTRSKLQVTTRIQLAQSVQLRGQNGAGWIGVCVCEQVRSDGVPATPIQGEGDREWCWILVYALSSTMNALPHQPWDRHACRHANTHKVLHALAHFRSSQINSAIFWPGSDVSCPALLGNRDNLFNFYQTSERCCWISPAVGCAETSSPMSTECPPP